MSLQFPPKIILKARNHFKEHPDGEVGFYNGFYYTWTKEEFYAWFRKCLLLKCGGQKYTEKEFNRLLDGRIINEHYGQRIRRSGRNILRHPKMKRLYPQIDNPEPIDY
jgi:hypothetical protein